MSIAVIKKRDGRIVPFDMKKISDAIEKSFRADTGPAERRAAADQLAWDVTTLLEQEGNPAPTVERIQDLVEQVLMDRGYLAAAKRYILYRQARTDARNRGERGKGNVILESWEPTLTGQAVAICAAIRNNGGAERLTGFYESLAPAAEEMLRTCYTNALRVTLEMRTGCRVARQTLRSIRLAVTDGGYSMTGQDPEAYQARQAELLCGTLGCDRAAVEEAQRAAFELAAEQTEEALRETLRCLHARGCIREMIVPPETVTPVLQMILDVEEKEP